MDTINCRWPHDCSTCALYDCMKKKPRAGRRTYVKGYPAHLDYPWLATIYPYNFI